MRQGGQGDVRPLCRVRLVFGYWGTCINDPSSSFLPGPDPSSAMQLHRSSHPRDVQGLRSWPFTLGLAMWPALELQVEVTVGSFRG